MKKREILFSAVGSAAGRLRQQRNERNCGAGERGAGNAD